MDTLSDIGQIREILASIQEGAMSLEERYADELANVHPEYREGAYNLVHYLALRKADTQSLRDALRRLGLYSLAHAERDVLGIIAAVRRALDALAGTAAPDPVALDRSGTTTDRQIERKSGGGAAGERTVA